VGNADFSLTIPRYGGKNRQQTPRRVTSLWHQCETDGAN